MYSNLTFAITLLGIFSIFEIIKDNKKFTFNTLYEFGSPENPSWNFDDSSILFNSYANFDQSLFFV